LPWRVGFDLILHAMEKTTEDKAWQMWLTRYPYMTDKTFKPFSEFYESMKQPRQQSTRPAEEILADAELTKRLIEGR